MIMPYGIKPKDHTEGLGQYIRSTSHIIMGYEIEAKGREIASKRDEDVLVWAITFDPITQWLVELTEWHDKLAFVYGKTLNIIDPRLEEDVKRMKEILLEIYKSYLAGFTLLTDMVKRSIQFLNPEVMRQYVKDLDKFMKYARNMIKGLVEYDELQMRYSGQSGLWLWGKIPSEEYTLAAYVNDLTSCFHNFLNYLARQVSNEVIPRRVYYVPPRNPYLINLVTKWWYSVEKLRPLYTNEDYEALIAVVKASEAEIRVGSAPGHLTHVVLKPLGLEITYYDEDAIVCDALSILARDFGCRIIVNVPGEYVQIFCPRLRGSDVYFMEYVLPFVTSMDLRMSTAREYWLDVMPREVFDKLYEESSGEIIIFEYLACKWAIENILKREKEG